MSCAFQEEIQAVPRQQAERLGQLQGESWASVRCARWMGTGGMCRSTTQQATTAVKCRWLAAKRMHGCPHLQRIERVEVQQLAQAEAQRQQQRGAVGVDGIEPAGQAVAADGIGKLTGPARLSPLQHANAPTRLTHPPARPPASPPARQPNHPHTHLVRKDSSSDGSSATL
jgi:hypothetical protein